MLILGIDDAGRGPIIGPMVLAGVIIDEEKEKELKKLGVKDSKALTKKTRSFLYKKIKELALDYFIISSFPAEIDEKLISGTNLNKVEAIKAGEIINKLVKNENKTNIIKVILDCPSPNKESWRDYLLRQIKHKDNLEIICEHKADRDFVVVSAASVLAKVARDSEIEKIKKKIGIDFGSGYTSDPLTQEFLQNYSHQFQHDGIFRKTWATWKNNKSKKQQKNLLDF